MQAKLTILFLAIALLFVVASAELAYSKESTKLSRALHDYISATKFCQQGFSTCIIETTAHGYGTDQTVSLGTYSYSAATIAELEQVRYFKQSKLSEDFSAYVHDPSYQLVEGSVCLDAYIMHIYDLPADTVETDDGSFSSGKSYLDLYECFVDADSRSNYLNSTRLFYILD